MEENGDFNVVDSGQKRKRLSNNSWSVDPIPISQTGDSLLSQNRSGLICQDWIESDAESIYKEIDVEVMPEIVNATKLHLMDIRFWCKNLRRTQNDSAVFEPISKLLKNFESLETTVDKVLSKAGPEDTPFAKFIITASGSVVMVLKYPKKCYFSGRFAATAIHGRVDILGHELSASDRGRRHVYSPRGCCHLGLVPKHHQDNLAGLGRKLARYGLDKDVELGVGAMDSVLLLESLQDEPVSGFLHKHISQQLYPTTNLKHEAENRLGSKFSGADPPWNVFEEGPKWPMVTKKFLDGGSPMMLCGGKGVGKSTLLRYLTNKAVAACGKVLIIDLDIGQSEFTVCGCVSATVVDEPLLGPNYMHLKTPLASRFVGDVNVANCTVRYLHCVQQLLDFCSGAVDSSLPCLVNFMGITKSLGTDLAAAAIRLVRPKVLVQITSHNRYRNYDGLLDADFVRSHVGAAVEFRAPAAAGLNYDTICMETVLEDAWTGGDWKLQPRQQREMTILAYFSRLMPGEMTSITEAVPYAVRLSDVNVHCLSPCQDVLAVVNGNMVALCVSDSGVPTQCLGFAIVRGISHETGEIYILTPEDENVLQKVDALVMGTISLPPSLYMTPSKGAGRVPYVTQNCLTSRLAAITKKTMLSAGQT